MPYLELDDGVRMWYEIHGREDGRNILLYHGWGASTAFWSEQIPLLVNMEYKVIALDGRGHGKSDKPRKGYNLDRLRQDFINFQDTLKMDEWAVVGHSAGGGVAQVTYHDYPDRTKALVLINTSYTIVETFQQKLFWNLLPTDPHPSKANACPSPSFSIGITSSIDLKIEIQENYNKYSKIIEA